jgi:cytochrome c biogenesis protein
VIPQSGVDSLKTSRWQADHPKLTPIYERLQLFSVYDSPWFAAIYILLMISLVGCIIPRLFVYWRALRAQPPAAPRHLDRLPVHTSYDATEPAADVLARARTVLQDKGYRVRVGDEWVAGERGYLREAGNLVFHLAVVVVLVGFAMGGLFGYKGGVILVVGNGFTNGLTQYDDFDPGSLFDADSMEPFSLEVDQFDVDWIDSGPRQGMARGFNAHLQYRESPDDPEQTYDLRVNHPLTIGGTEVFLIGHGYAPVITIRDGNGDVAYSGPTVFLPEDAGFRSFGVVPAYFAKPTPIGLQGWFFPTYVNVNGDPANLMGDLRNPVISLEAYVGDLGAGDGTTRSVYELDTSKATKVTKPDGSMFRVDLQPGGSVDLPDGAGSVTFEGVQKWTRLQISKTPGMHLTLGGVVAALIGLLLSLFIRPRRVWVRADGSKVDVAGLDRSSAGDVKGEVAEVVSRLRQLKEPDQQEERT